MGVIVTSDTPDEEIVSVRVRARERGRMREGAKDIVSVCVTKIGECVTVCVRGREIVSVCAQEQMR